MKFLHTARAFRQRAFLVLFGEIRIVADLVDLWFRISAQYYVGASARHVRRDGHHLGAPSLGNDLCFARVLFGIQHLVWKFLLLEQFCQSSEFSIEVVPTSTGCPL
jgi:hypothetical protein